MGLYLPRWLKHQTLKTLQIAKTSRKLASLKKSLQTPKLFGLGDQFHCPVLNKNARSLRPLQLRQRPKKRRLSPPLQRRKLPSRPREPMSGTEKQPSKECKKSTDLKEIPRIPEKSQSSSQREKASRPRRSSTTLWGDS